MNLFLISRSTSVIKTSERVSNYFLFQEEKKRSHHSEPYNSPTHAGGLFAIDRAWFEELGWYDPGLWVWG